MVLQVRQVLPVLSALPDRLGRRARLDFLVHTWSALLSYREVLSWVHQAHLVHQGLLVHRALLVSLGV